MEKKELIDTLNEFFTSIGFKKKGNFWVINSDVLTKIVNLQKSQFSNSFYINYGYTIKSIPLEGEIMHVFSGLGSIEVNENTRIKELLNLENNIPDEDRKMEFKQLITCNLVSKIQAVNTEKDLLDELRNREHLNDIPLVVKIYFDLM